MNNNEFFYAKNKNVLSNEIMDDFAIYNNKK